MLEITSHRNGEVLNHQQGQESADGLVIRLEGIADPQSLVTVNGSPAERRDRLFSAFVRLTEKISRVTVAAHNKLAIFSRASRWSGIKSPANVMLRESTTISFFFARLRGNAQSPCSIIFI